MALPDSPELVLEAGRASRNYWRDLWRYRDLLAFLTWRDLVVRYKQTFVGVAWALLQPLLTMAVFVIFGGLLGVPVGIWVLNNLPAKNLMLILGGMLTLYALYSLLKPAELKLENCNGAKSGLLVGALGGVIGGFTAFPGMTVVVWTGLRDLPKAATRTIVQPFILSLQIVSLITNGILHPHNFGVRFWTLLAMTIPVVLPGTLGGVLTYRRISEVNFKRFCFVLLLTAGAGLMLKAL